VDSEGQKRGSTAEHGELKTDYTTMLITAILRIFS
jgi:hypothetical protein